LPKNWTLQPTVIGPACNGAHRPAWGSALAGSSETIFTTRPAAGFHLARLSDDADLTATLFLYASTLHYTKDPPFRQVSLPQRNKYFSSAGSCIQV